jgi:L-iditol 2-dehydrogenase
MVFHIPESLSFEEASLIEPVAVAVHAVHRGHLKTGSDVLVIGAGPIGLLTAQAAKAAGAGRITCIDMNEHRLALARKLGIDRTASPGDASLENSADIVFETAGARAATASIFRYCRSGGTVVQVGWPGGNIVDMDIALFLEKELDYAGVNRYANAYPTAIEWIANGKINVKDLITNVFGLDDIAEAFTYTAGNPDTVMKTVVVNQNPRG